MTTKSGARVYRAAPRPKINQGCCPGCNKTISLTKDHRRRVHRKTDGELCTFSGTRVFEADDTAHFALTELPPIAFHPRDQRIIDGIDPAPQLRVARPPLELDRRRSDRAVSSTPCPECGRWTPTNRKTGRRRKHRVEADNPCAPYCDAPSDH